jgi:hypothetical protein
VEIKQEIEHQDFKKRKRRERERATQSVTTKRVVNGIGSHLISIEILRKSNIRQKRSDVGQLFE